MQKVVRSGSSSSRLKQKNFIKIKNLPKDYNVYALIDIFKKIDDVYGVIIYEQQLWMKFKNAIDLRPCLFYNNYEIQNKRIKIELAHDYGDENIKFRRYRNKSEIRADLKVEKQFKVEAQQRNEKNLAVKKIRKLSKNQEQIQNDQIIMKEAVAYITSRRYFNLLIILYIIYKILSFLCD